MKPDKEQVEAEIEKLTALKPRVRRHSLFGDDNHAAIDTEICVLRNDLPEDTIYDRYYRYDLNAALGARCWLDGDEGPPSEEWEILAEG